MEKKEDLLKFKIAKKAYVFDVRKRFAATRNFQLKKKPENPIDELKEKFGLFAKKRHPPGAVPKAGASEAAPGGGPEKKTNSTVAAVVTFAVVLVLFIIGGSLFVAIQLENAPGERTGLPKPDLFSGELSYSIEQSEIVSASLNDKTTRMGYFLASYKSENLSSLTFTVRLLRERPITQVFLLDYARESADTYPVFRKNLIANLARDNRMVNEIGVEQLRNLPGGATLIVPTGYMPKELLGLDSGYTYIDLLKRGVNIIYIGNQFDTLAIDKNGATIRVDHRSVTFTRGRPQSEANFSLFDAQYTVSPSSAEGGVRTGSAMIYGSVSVVRFGDGALIVLPQVLDGGWRSDGKTAAEDVWKIVHEARWIAPLAEATIDGKTKTNGTEMISLFTGMLDSENAVAEFIVDMRDNDGIARRSTDVLEVKKLARGEMTSLYPKTVPYYLSGQKTRLNVELKEDNSNPIKLYIRMYKEGVLLQEEELELGLTKPNTEKPKDFSVNAEPGPYLVRVEDNNNKVYAATALEVIDLNVDITGINWTQGQFGITLSADGQSVSPKSLAVSLDGAGTVRYEPSDLSFYPDRTTLYYEYRGQVNPGNHTITISAGDVWSKDVSREYRRSKNFWDNPLVLILGAMSGLVFGVGWILRRPEKLHYGLDVPDFPPLSKITIPVKRETVLDIFNTVNASYSWQWMPLRNDELKKGFSRLTYNGKPILIGDFNLDRVLSKMREEGLVKNELDYWGLNLWENESKHTLYYLTMYRIMRNVFVNNAVKFSKIDSMPDCDVKAIVGKEELYLHIMEEPIEKVVHRALATAKKSSTIIIFRNEEARDRFKDSLTSTSKLAVALKMEVNNGNIHLFPVKHAISAFLRGSER